MSVIDIGELPVADAGRRGRRPALPGGTSKHSRRDFIGYAVRGATLVGLMGLSLFRAPRRAGADNPPWYEFTSCGPYDPGTAGESHPCGSNMCVGTSLEMMDNTFCTTDCDQVDDNNWYQWHKNRTYGHVTYRDSPTNRCAPVDDDWARDAWWWNVGRCGSCAPAIYRCHDGEKRTGANGEWAYTICEGLARCSGDPVTC